MTQHFYRQALKTPVSELFNNSAEHTRRPLWSFTLPLPPSREDLGCTEERASTSRVGVRMTFWRSVRLSDDRLVTVKSLKVFNFLQTCHQMERLDSSHVSSIWWSAPSTEKKNANMRRNFGMWFYEPCVPCIFRTFKWSSVGPVHVSIFRINQ